MSSTTYDWFTVDDNDDLEGDGTVSVGSIHTHGGRTGRNASIVLTTTDNVQAVISVVQGGAEEQIQIEQFEDGKGVALDSLPTGGGIYYLVGYSNCRYLTASETSAKTNTDMNDNSGILKQVGFTLYEDYGLGEMHIGVRVNTYITPDYGASNVYMFKMPFYLSENSTSASVPLSFSVSNQSGNVTDTVNINQTGIS